MSCEVTQGACDCSAIQIHISYVVPVIIACDVSGFFSVIQTELLRKFTRTLTLLTTLHHVDAIKRMVGSAVSHNYLIMSTCSFLSSVYIQINA